MEPTVESDATVCPRCRGWKGAGHKACPACIMAERGSHRPAPGPLHWDWRCRVCGEAVSDHPSWWRRLLDRVLSPGADQ